MPDKYFHAVMIFFALSFFLVIVTHDQLWNPIAKYGYSDCQYSALKNEHSYACNAIGVINPWPGILAFLCFFLSIVSLFSAVVLYVKKSKRKSLKIYLFAYALIYFSIPILSEYILRGL